MKKSIKTIIKVILTIVACLSFILMSAERQDGSACLPWSLGCMAAFAISAILLDKMDYKDETI